jgi:neutral ceramidase
MTFKQHMRWLAGAATAELAVKPGTAMAGYLAREGPAESTHDPLTVSAFVVMSDGALFVLLAVDLLGVDRDLVEEIAREAGVAPDSIALAASHTHSGPAGIISQPHQGDGHQIDPVLRARFVATCGQTVRSAMARMEPADVSIGSDEAIGIAANRNDRFGPFDPTVTVIQAKRLTGSSIATIVHFACHPTILPAASRVISAEFPGILRRQLGASVPGVIFFINGAAGDVSTRFTRANQDFQEVERVGSVLASAAMRALGNTRAIEGELARGSVHINLPVRSAGDVEQASELAIIAEQRMATGLLSTAELRIEQTRIQGALLLERLMESNLAQVSRSIQAPWWRLGDLRLLGIPGELFASLGAAIIESLPDAIVLGYTNGYIGYLPDRAAYDAGLYEALASPYAAGAGEQLVETLIGTL